MSNARTPLTGSSQRATDVIVVGDGVIGLACALAIARAGGSCRVLGQRERGAASPASGGLLAPSIGSADDEFRAFMRSSRDLYPEWVRWLAERTGVDITLSRSGIIELLIDAGQIASLSAEALDSAALRSMEPELAWSGAARIHGDDGFVDNVRLLAALTEAVRCEWSIDSGEGRVAAIQAGVDGCSVSTEDGRTQPTRRVVIAAGAWSPLIAGLPRPIPVEPVRGQMLLLHGCPINHALSTPDGYLVPRGESTLIGSTLERVGFDNTTTSTAKERLRAAAVAVLPALGAAEVDGFWAGLRPMTPDGLPLLGRDPDLPSVIYACGHGKNGILLAPITGDVVAAIAADSTPAYDISRYAVERFLS
jgi:glycine oxidase